MVDVKTKNGKPSGIDEQEYADRLDLLRRARSGDRQAAQALADRYKLRIFSAAPAVQHTATLCDTVKREGVMEMGSGELVACPICGMQVKKQGLGVHKARKHGNGHALRADPLEHMQRPAAKVQRAAAEDAANGCDRCPFRGLDSPVARVLVAQAIQAGMELEPAAQFVRSAQAAFGRLGGQ